MAREVVNGEQNPYAGAETVAAEGKVRPEAAGRKFPAISRGNLMLGGLFLAGIAGVYLLSLRNSPANASAEESTAEAQVDSALSMLSKARPSSPDRQNAPDIVNSFYYAAVQRQIPLDRLKGNPFVFRPPHGVAPTTKPVEAKSAPVEDEGAKELSEAMVAVRDLRLQSVLIGKSGATAIISNNLLSEGQTIQGWTVSKIQAREVLLMWKDQKFVLKMQE